MPWARASALSQNPQAMPWQVWRWLGCSCRAQYGVDASDHCKSPSLFAWRFATGPGWGSAHPFTGRNVSVVSRVCFERWIVAICSLRAIAQAKLHRSKGHAQTPISQRYRARICGRRPAHISGRAARAGSPIFLTVNCCWPPKPASAGSSLLPTRTSGRWFRAAWGRCGRCLTQV